MFTTLPIEIREMITRYLVDPADRICLKIALQADLPIPSPEVMDQAEYDQEDYEQEEQEFWVSAPEYEDDFDASPMFDDFDEYDYGFDDQDQDQDFGDFGYL